MSRNKLLCLATCMVAGLIATTQAADNPWLGARVMPRNESLTLGASSQYTGTIHDIAWPAVVTRVEGQWLWIDDSSGYSHPPVSGWVRKDDVITLDKAQTYYTSQMQTSSQPALRWLRGICWESRGETAIALSEYQAALTQRPDLVDADLRIARIESQTPSDDRPWIARFERVTQSLGSRPRPYFEYAEALRRHYQSWVDEQTGVATFDAGSQAEIVPASKSTADTDASAKFADADFQRSLKLYQLALERSRHWPMASMGMGELLMARAGWQELQSSMDADREANILKAIVYFDEAILSNPKQVDAYRDRGEAYRRLHKYSLARQSAHRACELTDFRQPRSLATLASTYSDLGNFERAAYYYHKAGIYAPDEIRHDIVAQRDACLNRIASSDPPKKDASGTIPEPESNRSSTTRKVEMYFPAIAPRPLSAAQ